MPAYKDEKRNTWYASFYYVDWQGIRHKKKKRGFALKREAEAYEREFLLKNSGEPDMLFSTLIDLYYADIEKRIRSTSLTNKQNIINTHILPYFKNKKVVEITNTDIRSWQNTLLNKKNPHNNKPYSATYLRSINSQLSAIFNFAVAFYKLSYNPCSQVKAIGKKKAPEMHFWTLDQFNTVIKYEQHPSYHIVFMILYWCGVRIGECLALTPEKIIHKTKSLNIKQSYRREDGNDILGDTKSDNGTRNVSMPDFVYDELLIYINSLYEIGNDERIFYFTHSAVRQELTRIAKLAGVKRIRVHDLRHSHVSLLIELGYRTHAIAARIGDTPQEVDRTYAHLYPNKGHVIAQELSRHKERINTAVNNIDEDGIVYNDKELAETLQNTNMSSRNIADSVEPK
jgi:integrase